MDKKIKRRWVRALESGKYRGCKGQLCRVAENGSKSYCCLGVLNEVCGLGVSEYDDILPLGVLYKIGLSMSEHDHLISMNDEHRRGFKGIAKWIRKHL